MRTLVRLMLGRVTAPSRQYPRRTPGHLRRLPLAATRCAPAGRRTAGSGRAHPAVRAAVAVTVLRSRPSRRATSWWCRTAPRAPPRWLRRSVQSRQVRTSGRDPGPKGGLPGEVGEPFLAGRGECETGAEVEQVVGDECVPYLPRATRCPGSMVSRTAAGVGVRRRENGSPSGHRRLPAGTGPRRRGPAAPEPRRATARRQRWSAAVPGRSSHPGGRRPSGTARSPRSRRRERSAPTRGTPGRRRRFRWRSAGRCGEQAQQHPERVRPGRSGGGPSDQDGAGERDARTQDEPAREPLAGEQAGQQGDQVRTDVHQHRGGAGVQQAFSGVQGEVVGGPPASRSTRRTPHASVRESSRTDITRATVAVTDRACPTTPVDVPRSSAVGTIVGASTTRSDWEPRPASTRGRRRDVRRARSGVAGAVVVASAVRVPLVLLGHLLAGLDRRRGDRLHRVDRGAHLRRRAVRRTARCVRGRGGLAACDRRRGLRRGVLLEPRRRHPRGRCRSPVRPSRWRSPCRS